MNILVIGGYGNFGKRLVKSLVEFYDYQIIVAGRSKNIAQAFCSDLKHQFGKTVRFCWLDVFTSDLTTNFKLLEVDIVVNASGPYQLQSNYRVARACIEAGCNYIDFADAREFVTNFSSELDAQAKSAKIMLVSGASTVPALTAAVIDHYLPRFETLHTINYGISPGNRTERSEGTVGSVLSYTGKSFTTLINGRYRTVYGWQNLELHDFGKPLGRRWMSNCNIPDLDLLPRRYPSLQNVIFKAGFEVTTMHCGLWLLSWLSRFGLIEHWSRYTQAITTISRWLQQLGSDSGGMFVRLHGNNLEDQPLHIDWQLVAEQNVGPNTPTISAELIIKLIAEERIQFGAMPCMGLFSLSEFMAIAARWGMYEKEVIL